MTSTFHMPVRRSDFGEHAYFGLVAASKREHKQYLRQHKLGKFAKA